MKIIDDESNGCCIVDFVFLPKVFLPPAWYGETNRCKCRDEFGCLEHLKVDCGPQITLDAEFLILEGNEESFMTPSREANSTWLAAGFHHQHFRHIKEIDNTHDPKKIASCLPKLFPI